MENLTYQIEARGNKPIYKYLYECIRDDIRKGKIAKGERLPSKRVLASGLKISVITVENAYSLLEEEGYIRTVEKKGFYVEDDIIGNPDRVSETTRKEAGKEATVFLDLSTNYISADSFPFDAWSRLSRRVLLDREESFLHSPYGTGVPELREAISRYLYEEKGIEASPDNILIGPGTEYLHHILIQLLGRNNLVAVEDPGYKKVGMIYESNGVRVLHIPVDDEGMMIDKLPPSGVKLIHISPSHHFPTGCIMPADRRKKLIRLADEQDAYIIEDDYDSEFRFPQRPIPNMYSLGSDKVIYMNTFTRSLAPSVRIAYMILPEKLMETRPIERIISQANGRDVELLKINKIKKYAPGVEHVVVDARIY